MVMPNMINQWYYRLNDVMPDWAQSRVAILGLSVAVVGVLAGGGWFLYYQRSVAREQAAQLILAQCLNEYEKGITDATVASQVDGMAQVGYRQYGNTHIGPFFLALRVDALLAQGQRDEALKLLQEVIKGLASQPMFAQLYRIKYALILLDTVDAAQVEQALSLLEQEAHYAQGYNNDRALYYLGAYYGANGNTERAQQYWNELVSLPAANDQSQSPWAHLAKEKLESITSSE